jgi:hypothetical protein
VYWVIVCREYAFPSQSEAKATFLHTPVARETATKTQNLEIPQSGIGGMQVGRSTDENGPTWKVYVKENEEISVYCIDLNFEPCQHQVLA